MSGHQLSATTQAISFAADVREGLRTPGQRELPSIYLYDQVGTALFETITLLPEYGLTRADERLMRRYATEILDRVAPPLLIAELGSGTGKKTRWLLEAMARREPVRYFPIDISASALYKCRQELSELGSLSIVGLETSYLEGLEQVARYRHTWETLLVLFLGSTIGNFERAAAEEFLRAIRDRLSPGDAMLLGTDLEKDVVDMLLAYNDPTGVTRAFNLNLLARINRELGGNFDLSQWEHEARWNESRKRIEMHLRSLCAQTVIVPAAEFSCTFRPDETIWTEACHKFQLQEIPAMLQRAGFTCNAQWVDGEWAFAENLCFADDRPPLTA